MEEGRRMTLKEYLENHEGWEIHLSKRVPRGDLFTLETNGKIFKCVHPADLDLAYTGDD